MSRWLKIGLLLPAVASIMGCGLTDEGAVVARVGGRELTLARVMQEIPSDAADSVKALASQTFVNRWVEEELLLLEARHRKIDEDSRVESAVETYRRKLLISRLLDLAATEDSLVMDADVATYYGDHRSEFVRSDSEVMMAYLVGADREAVRTARAAWIEGAQFADLLASEMTVWGDDSIMVSRGELESMGNMIFGMGEGALSEVQSLGDRWAVFKVYRRYGAGSARELPEVAAEIRARLLVTRQNQARNRFLDGLRSKYPVEVHEDLLPKGSNDSQGDNR